MEPNPCKNELNKKIKLLLNLEVYYVRGIRKIT